MHRQDRSSMLSRHTRLLSHSCQSSTISRYAETVGKWRPAKDRSPSQVRRRVAVGASTGVVARPLLESHPRRRADSNCRRQCDCGGNLRTEECGRPGDGTAETTLKLQSYVHIEGGTTFTCTTCSLLDETHQALENDFRCEQRSLDPSTTRVVVVGLYSAMLNESCIITSSITRTPAASANMVKIGTS